MTNCELCGKRTDDLVYSVVEGVKLQTCVKCSGFGKFAGSVKKQVFEEKEERFVKNDDAEEELIVEDFAVILRNKREKLGMSQKDFAMKINEKESFVANLENGRMSLSLETAKKLEILLHIALVFRQKAVHLGGKTERTGALTIGDLIKGK